jgi:hypothetical protein
MKIYFLLVFIIFCASGAFAQDADCLSKFKTGKFTYEGWEGKISIIRTKTTQIETYNNGTSKIIMKIKWVGPREYVLTHVKSINAPGCLKEGDTIRARIIRCTSTSFTCEWKANRCGSGTNTLVLLK